MAEERETERIWATISKERYDQLREWADELGIQFSQYIALVAWMGASQLRRTLHPEQYIPADVMAEAIAKAASQSFTPDVMSQAMSQAISHLIDKMPAGTFDETSMRKGLAQEMSTGYAATTAEALSRLSESHSRSTDEALRALGKVGENYGEKYKQDIAESVRRLGEKYTEDMKRINQSFEKNFGDSKDC